MNWFKKVVGKDLGAKALNSMKLKQTRKLKKGKGNGTRRNRQMGG